MPLQDLTPQLRTRLNRMEKATGAFILVATFLMLFGFGFYIYRTAEDKGWFSPRARFYTYARTAAGLQIGDPIKLVGFKAGEITAITPMRVDWYVQNENVLVEFLAVNDAPGYLWTEGSHVKFNDVSFLGKRELEINKGTGGTGTYLRHACKNVPLEQASLLPNLDQLKVGEEVVFATNAILNGVTNSVPFTVIKVNSPLAVSLEKFRKLGRTNVWVLETDKKEGKKFQSVWNAEEHHYEPVTPLSKYFLPPEENVVLGDRLQAIVAQGQAALPGILDLTNKVSAVLVQISGLASNLSIVANEARTTVTNLAVITGHLKDPHGSLGEWAIPTNLNARLNETLQTADGSLMRLDTNLETLNLSLDHLAGITSNLNLQVQSNTNILGNISGLIVHSDEFVQGLKKFWLFRSTFAPKKKPAQTTLKVDPLVAPKYKK